MSKNLLQAITLFATMSLLLLSSCGKLTDKVVLTYPDGSKMVVQQYKGDCVAENLCAEMRYYADGKVQYEKHYKGIENPCGTWKYFYDDEKLFASADFDKTHATGINWKFLDREGRDYFKLQCDSMRVVELSEMQTPATVALFCGSEEVHYQFYSNYTVRSLGKFVNGKRQGRWVFYHPNGTIQTDAEYILGLENGTYTVYRENGVPYYRGMYENGKRVGKWEFYDAEGNLLQAVQQ